MLLIISNQSVFRIVGITNANVRPISPQPACKNPVSPLPVSNQVCISHPSNSHPPTHSNPTSKPPSSHSKREPTQPAAKTVATTYSPSCEIDNLPNRSGSASPLPKYTTSGAPLTPSFSSPALTNTSFHPRLAAPPGAALRAASFAANRPANQRVMSPDTGNWGSLSEPFLSSAVAATAAAVAVDEEGEETGNRPNRARKSRCS